MSVACNSAHGTTYHKNGYVLAAATTIGGIVGLGGGYFLFPIWPIAVLVLAISTVTDLRCNKVYNLVTFPATVLGLTYHIMTGNAWFGLIGLSAGFLMLWPVYWMGGTRAGDVKLLTSFGAMMGNQAVLATGLAASLLFLAYAIVFYARRGEVRQWISVTCLNARYLALRQLDGEKVSAEEIAGSEHTVPFGPFIALGALVYYIMGVINWSGVSVF